MTCERGGGTIICWSEIHQHTFNGRTWLFESPYNRFPHPLRKDGEPFKRVPNAFWEAYEDWCKIRSKRTAL